MFIILLRVFIISLFPSPSICHVPAGAFGRAVQRKLQDEDLWRGQYSKVREVLRAGHAVCERWGLACDTLTSQYWKRYGPNPWTGDRYKPLHLLQLANRLEEVSLHLPTIGLVILPVNFEF